MICIYLMMDTELKVVFDEVHRLLIIKCCGESDKV